MQVPSLQQTRSEQIIRRFQQLDNALALFVPIPSCQSQESTKLLTFHAAVKSHESQNLQEELSWLSEVQHVAYQYQRSENGKRMVFSDGVLCDFYLHAKTQLEKSNPKNWQVEWHTDSSKIDAFPPTTNLIFETQTEWLLGELLTNLTLGLRHFTSNERLAAFQCIQQHALNHLLTLMALFHFPDKPPAGNIAWDSLAQTKSVPIDTFAPGLEHSPNAANAILEHLESMHSINHFVKDQILNLIASCLTPTEP